MAVLDEQVFGKSSAKRKGKSKLKVVTIRPKGHGK
jgi:hypothetical protein